jgi:hypothetical protein
MRKKAVLRKWLVWMLCALLFVLVGGVSAREVLRGDACTVEADRIIEGDVFVLCEVLLIEGRIEGNLFGAARNALITGTVEGSVYLLAGQLDFGGTMSGNLHFAGVALNTEQPADFTGESSSLVAASLSSFIAPDVILPGSVLNLGYQLIISGRVDREVNFWGSALTLNGAVERHITATVGDAQSRGVAARIEPLLIPFRFVEVDLIDPGLTVTESGRIGGDLAYTSPTEGRIEGETAGDIFYRSSARQLTLGTTVQENARTLRRYLASVLREFGTLAIFGVIGLLLAPKQMQAPLRPMLTRPLSTFGVGLLSFILSFPIVLIIFLFSILLVIILSLLPLDTIVLFVGLVLGLANIGGASLFYFTAIFIARIIVGLGIGLVVLRLLKRADGSRRDVLIALGVGLLILSAFAAIPEVGWIFQALSLFLGLGGILTVLRNQLRRFREDSTVTQPIRYTSPRFSVPNLAQPISVEQAAQYLPPALDDGEDSIAPQPTPRTGPGTDNLPPGFRWWEE